MTTLQHDLVASAYDCLAPFYDDFTAGYSYDDWLTAIEACAVRLGLRGRRALDLACGTGKSTAPLLSRGYDILACDISEGMIAQARNRLPDSAGAFFVADMRALPHDIGPFDLVVCLDDAINYLLTIDDLDAVFAAVARVLGRDGVFAFDLNSLRTYRSWFAEPLIRRRQGLLLAWQGEGDGTLAPGEVGAATVDIFVRRDVGLWHHTSMRHIQRHHSPETIRRALARNGLDCVLLGQHPGARFEKHYDESVHTKAMYFARHAI